jgi:hypothetical protein
VRVRLSAYEPGSCRACEPKNENVPT